jgi:hypothetical protein
MISEMEATQNMIEEKKHQLYPETEEANVITIIQKKL